MDKPFSCHSSIYVAINFLPIGLFKYNSLFIASDVLNTFLCEPMSKGDPLSWIGHIRYYAALSDSQFLLFDPRTIVSIESTTTNKQNSSSSNAEREGFEPSIAVTHYAGLANLCLQPLGHLSELNVYSLIK
jgi:hypothetical protein